VSIGAPATGAASAPAITAADATRLGISVLGGDGLLYWLVCTDPDALCAASAAQQDAWAALPAPPSGTFIGKPSALWLRNTTTDTRMVVAVDADRIAWFASGPPGAWGAWIELIYADLEPADPNPSVAIESWGTVDGVSFLARNRLGQLADLDLGFAYKLGGVLASAPGGATLSKDWYRRDVAALIDDHGKLGVWWRYLDFSYQSTCNYNQPGACLQCGCGSSGQPSCVR
jgi:hypothetical protein